ncbi:HTH_Tnp_Tc3_2 domain-containing protein [Trichonephila clavipes]|nr:HTH_Tnp_Tc3_2 domain-containing protein [Trichonephila clavipes]
MPFALLRMLLQRDRLSVLWKKENRLYTEEPKKLLQACVTAATVAGYQDLSEFEHGVIVSAREMGHRIFEVAMKFGFLFTTISRVYLKYRESGKTSNVRHRCGRKKIMQEQNQRRLTRIIKRDRRATLPQIAADFNVGPSPSVTV